MTTAMPLAAPKAERDARTQEVIDGLDPDFLTLMRWDWNLRVLFFPEGHSLLGARRCSVQGCERQARAGWGLNGPLCTTCMKRWTESGLDNDAAFHVIPRQVGRQRGQRRCRVPDCGRPERNSLGALCESHEWQRTQTLGVPMDVFLRHPAVKPLARLGVCEVASCHRDRNGARSIYCQNHRQMLAQARRNDTVAFDEERWRLTVRPISTEMEISLRGLPLRVVAEVLFGLQVRTNRGVQTWDYWLRPVVEGLRRMGLSTVAELDTGDFNRTQTGLINGMKKAVARVGATPETECRKVIWVMAVFGYRGELNFTAISQAPLREALMAWAADEVPRRRGATVTSAVQAHVNAMAKLSESLRLQRDDDGVIPRLLGRRDIINFCNRLGFLVENGEMTAGTRLTYTRYVRKALARIHTLGLTAPGQPMAGLPTDFALSREDLPDEPEDTEAGSDLPDEVMRQLCDNLDALEQTSCRAVRVAVELLIDTGRRPDEVCRLKWDCLEKDPDGTLVLLYDNHKAYRLGRRLPIGAVTGAVITAQQEYVRQRFPNTPVSELALLPTSKANPEGRKSIVSVWQQHRNWVQALPEFMVPLVVEVEGQPVMKMVPFDKDKVFPYAYRHSFAQRHADKGVAVDVLKELMDHRQLKTTQRYYRVSQERRREAVDRVTAMQFDRHGNRVWRKAQGLMESEHVRRAISEVATAYGVCKEPSNVAAGGQACPIRFRCVGCEHFKTDVSYLPDLERYLDDLLRSRERLMSAFEADDWARSEAMPSEEEIRRVRRLIDRVKAEVDELTDEEQAQINEAVAVVRRGRTVMLGMPHVSQPQPDVRAWMAS